MVHADLGLPEELMGFCGVLLGYRDVSQPINQLVTERAPLAAIVAMQNLPALKVSPMQNIPPAAAARDHSAPKTLISSSPAPAGASHSSLAAIDSIKDTS
jgi:hypothetical protein